MWLYSVALGLLLISPTSLSANLWGVGSLKLGDLAQVSQELWVIVSA